MLEGCKKCVKFEKLNKKIKKREKSIKITKCLRSKFEITVSLHNLHSAINVLINDEITSQ